MQSMRWAAERNVTSKTSILVHGFFTVQINAYKHFIFLLFFYKLLPQNSVHNYI